MTKSVEAVDLVNTTKAYHAAGSSASTSGRIVHVSGQPGATKDGLVPSDYESQIHLALHNVRKVVLAAGGDVPDIAKLTVFIVNYDPARRKHTRHIQRFLRGHRPAMSLVPVTQLAVPSWLVEIEATAVVPQKQLSLPPALSGTTTRVRAVDVVVIGAGLAGLSAARKLTRSGLRTVVLESRDRVGGKTWSQPMGEDGGVIELGAAWINDVNQTRMIALAREFGLELIEQNTTGDCVFQGFDGKVHRFPYGELPKFDAATQADVARIRDMVEADCQKVDTWHPQSSELDALTFEGYLVKNGASPTALATAAVWTRAMLGHNPADISALFFLNYCKSGGGLLTMRSDRKGGGQALRIRTGTQSFSRGLAGALPPGTVRLNTPVSDVVQQRGEASAPVDVVTAAGDVYRASKVVVTAPSPALKEINFVPRLTLAKQAWTDTHQGAYYVKAMVVFKSPFWVAKGLCGLVQSFSGPASVVRDTSSPPDGKYALTCFMAGDVGAEWGAKSADERRDALLEQIGTLYEAHAEVKAEFVEVVSYDWTSDVWTGYHCPTTSLTPGLLSSVGSGTSRDAVGNVHFAGTETAGEWKGYMEGAVRSGERAADEVVKGVAQSSRL